jgi:hypothetical protein
MNAQRRNVLLSFQIPLYKLFLIVAVYAAAFGALSHFGSIGITIAAVIGTAGSLLVIAIHDRKAILSSVIVAFGSLSGAFFTFIFMMPVSKMPASMRHYTFDDYVRDWIILSARAILGGIFLSWASKR